MANKSSNGSRTESLTLALNRDAGDPDCRAITELIQFTRVPFDAALPTHTSGLSVPSGLDSQCVPNRVVCCSPASVSI